MLQLIRIPMTVACLVNRLCFYIWILTCFHTIYKPIFILRIRFSSNLDLRKMVGGYLDPTKLGI